MGWIFSICIFVSYAFIKDSSLLIAAGLFAIAGAISFFKNKTNNETIIISDKKLDERLDKILSNKENKN